MLIDVLLFEMAIHSYDKEEDFLLYWSMQE